MALSPKRIFEGGQTDFPWEREAIDFVLQELPDSDPHLAWPLHELLDPGSGRLYEIDLMVLSRSGLYLIEIKSHPGVLTGDSLDWTFTEEGGRPRHLACPFPATNLKAKVLGGLLDRKLGRERPFVNPLVFVSHKDTRINLTGGRPEYVVDRDTIRQALVHGSGGSRGRVVNRPMMRAMRDTLRELGLQPSKASREVAGFKLQRLVDEREGYQEHHAVSTTVEGDATRVRSYLVPKATTTERRHQLERAARREAQVLSRLGHHPRILSYRAYHNDGPLGPAVLFEAFEHGLPLNIFLKREPDLSFDDRLHILQAVVEAVDHCHRADFLHRNLSPASVLVRRTAGELEVRVHRFQTAAQSDHTSLGTRHVSQLAEQQDQLYQAPEVLRDPRKAVPASDVFSIGCLAWFLFTGTAPAGTLREREKLLREQEGLRIAAVRSDLANLDEALAYATEYSDINRADNALNWFEGFLLEDLTRPGPSEEEKRDPYNADKGTTLAGGLTVVRVLGSGATAKVLKVRRDDRSYALKVPHDEGCAARLLDEAQVLQRLRHQHIIQIHDVLNLPERRCLLLDYAGVGAGDKHHSSFADLLRAEGTLSLDKARRYGDDLLSAVQYLEEQGITHRDIKPGNLGFTTQSKKARHLTLYDFSLAAGEAGAISVGTPEWRDPWLHHREKWDAAADRWAVACVLYRMVAGTRPEVADRGPDQGQVTIETERFDPAVRDRMRIFFEGCFQEDINDRYLSAEVMRSYWAGVFSQLTAPSQEDQEPEDLEERLASATPDTLVEALPFTARARNALDRAGIVTVAHLLQLPRNHLSAIRGVGHTVAREIVEVATILGRRLSVHELPPLMPDYAGPRLGLEAEELNLAPDAARKLQDAGITSTTDLARMPAEWAGRLLGDELLEAAQKALGDLHQQHAPEGTLSAWVQELLAPAKQRKTAAEQRIRALVGLDPLPGKADDSEPAGGRTIKQVSAAFGVEAPLVHSSMLTMRRRWQDAPCRPELEAALGDVMDALGPVCTLADAADELLRLHGTADEQDPEQQARARALVRLATELRPAPVHWRRLGRAAWIAHSAHTLDTLAGLAAEADALAGQETVASSEAVRERLTRRARGSDLEPVPPDRLIRLAANASDGAAASARMEIYPRGMKPERALGLSLNVLTPPGLTEDAVRSRVHSRYPEALALPDRPALDRLMAAHELRFDPRLEQYVRPGLDNLTTSGTIMAPSRYSTAAPHQRRLRTPGAMEAQAFQDALDRGVESGRFRVVQVRADFSEAAAEHLANELGVPPISLDRRVWETMQRIAVEKKVDPDLITMTDREGPGTDDWDQLLGLAQLAADQVVEAVLSDRKAVALLVHPGVLARYGLSKALNKLAERAQHKDGAAVVLVVPSHADGRSPSINNQIPVPTEGAGQRLFMPESWLRNEHRAAAD